MQTDTWWQLRSGQDMWRSKQVLLTDIYSHTSSGSFWPNHEWGAELVFYVLYRIGGFPLLTLFAAALISGGWALTWRLTRATGREKAFWIGLALMSSAGWWEPRPHAFSLLFIPATVFLISRDRPWLLPVVFLIWANVHGGVVLGLVLLAIALGARTVIERERWSRNLLVFLACCVAVTLTPLGVAYWIEIPRSLGRINQYTLDEWKRPGFTEGPLIPFWGIAIFFCALLVRNVGKLRKVSAADAPVYACALVMLAGAVTSVRHVGPFLMLAVPAVSFLREGDRKRDPASEQEHPLLNLVLMSGAALAVALTLFYAYRNEVPRLKWRPLPAGALAAIGGCPDNLYNRYDEGGALLWFAQGRKVFLDGRQDPYPAGLVLEHINMETGDGEYRSVFSRHGIHCAFLPAKSPTAKRLSADGWKELYRDRVWVVFRD
jgi:hypothetical protein